VLEVTKNLLPLAFLSIPRQLYISSYLQYTLYIFSFLNASAFN